MGNSIYGLSKIHLTTNYVNAMDHSFKINKNLCFKSECCSILDPKHWGESDIYKQTITMLLKNRAKICFIHVNITVTFLFVDNIKINNSYKQKAGENIRDLWKQHLSSEATIWEKMYLQGNLFSSCRVIFRFGSAASAPEPSLCLTAPARVKPQKSPPKIHAAPAP